MKNKKGMQKLSLALGCMLLLTWACGGKKKEDVAAEVNTETAVVVAASEQIKSTQQVIQAKLESLGSSIDTVSETSNLGRTLNGRYKLDAILERGDKIKKDLEQLSSDFAAGKVTEEQYKQQFAALQELSKQYEESAKRLSENINKAIQ